MRSKFWDKVSVEKECWVWTASCNSHGYGKITRDGSTIAAHRIAYEEANGPIASDLVIRHRCDNRKCVNPAHLVAGTQKDNMDDMARRGRRACFKGERHGNAKLNEDKVRAIRADARPQKIIAAHYGVSVPTISEVKNRKIWVHV